MTDNPADPKPPVTFHQEILQFARVAIWPLVLVFAIIWITWEGSTLLDRPFTAKTAGVEISLSANSDARAVLGVLLDEIKNFEGDPNESKKIAYLYDLLNEYQVFVTTLSSQNPIDLDSTYKKVFRSIIQKNLNASKSLLDKLYIYYPTFYNIHEIRTQLSDNPPKNDQDWAKLHSLIVEKYSWKAPIEELTELKQLTDGG